MILLTAIVRTRKQPVSLNDHRTNGDLALAHCKLSLLLGKPHPFFVLSHHITTAPMIDAIKSSPITVTATSTMKIIMHGVKKSFRARFLEI